MVGMKEHVEELKERREMGTRKYKRTLTVGDVMDMDMDMFFLIDLEKAAPQLKEYPIKFTLDKFVKIHNTLLIEGPDITRHTPYGEALGAIVDMMVHSDFLGFGSTSISETVPEDSPDGSESQ